MTDNENEQKLNALQKKFFPDLTLDELREKTHCEVNVMLSFDSEADLELFTALPRLESLIILSPLRILTADGYKVLSQIPTLRELRIEDIGYPKDVMEVVLNMKHIVKVGFSWLRFGQRIFDVLAGASHLKSLLLDFHNEPIPETFLDVLKTLPQLEELSLGYCSFKADKLLDVVKDFPNLHNLNVFQMRMTEEDAARLKQMKNLDSFQLVCPSQRKDQDEPEEDLGLLDEGERLKELSLSGFQTIRNFDWDLPNLKSLHIIKTPNLESIDFLKIPELTHFSFFGLDPSSPIELKDLDTLEKLESLSYYGPKVERSIYRQLEMLPQLKSLSLWANNPLEPEDVYYLSSLKQLQDLSLFVTKDMTVQDLKELGTFPHLKRLCIQNVQSPEIIEAFLERMPVLESLSVLNESIDDQGIGVIQGFPNIRELNIFSCSDVSSEGIQTLFSMKNLRFLRVGKGETEFLDIHDLPHLRLLELFRWTELKVCSIERLPELLAFPLTSQTLERISFQEMDTLLAVQLQNCRSLESIQFRKIPKLVHLNLIGSNNQDLSGLIGLPNLRELGITYEQIRQDLVLETLQEIPTLEEIAIECSPPKDNVDINVVHNGIRHETLDDCPCNEEEREKIQKALPNCKVSFLF